MKIPRNGDYELGFFFENGEPTKIRQMEYEKPPNKIQISGPTSMKKSENKMDTDGFASL